MARFLALQGPPKAGGQSLIYELDQSADRDKLAEEMASAAVLDRVVPVPAVFQQTQRRTVTLYVRPAAWGVWAFYEMSDEERRQMIAANPLVNALAQAARQQQGRKPTGPGVP